MTGHGIKCNHMFYYITKGTVNNFEMGGMQGLGRVQIRGGHETF